ncbi:CsgG/HfaB family protein [Arenicella xantha]|uniref:Curli production assembly/transport component CsgG n=1 Tax=Arenicella xantha TaxID=644221 RepID=A0A395JI81_9GAMM|nr:CsgG/HfaB family protein [Arenicella xantha]RBP49735.1 curli biogenesis system outer membrane secretion channel CsgG [Arenicella xantha]
MKFIKILALLLVTTLFTNAAHADKPTMAVLDFRNNTNAGWWGSSVGRELGGMLTNELASGKKFRMIERQKLASVLGEQDLAASGRVSGGQAAKMGKMVGAQYLVTATVSSFESNVNSTGGGISFKGVSLGGKSKKAYIAVDLRVVDSTTGEIVDTRTVEARSGGLGMSIGLSRGGFGGALANEKKTPAGKAIRAVIAEISGYLECSMVTKGKCLKKYEAKERKRREGLSKGIDLD